MIRILTVCTGNLCRSPMAMAYLRHRFQRQGIAAEVRSAGIMAVTGAPAPDPVQRVLAAEGIDLANHRARPLMPEDVAWAQHILVMEPWHRAWVVQRSPDCRERVYLLSEWLPGGDPRQRGIPDPYGSSVAAYRSVWVLIRKALDRWMEQILGIAPDRAIMNRG